MLTVLYWLFAIGVVGRSLIDAFTSSPANPWLFWSTVVGGVLLYVLRATLWRASGQYSPDYQYETTPLKQWDLHALGVSNNMSGSFFLASGEINNVLTYRFLAKYDGVNGFQLDTMRVDGDSIVSVVEDIAPDGQPFLAKMRRTYRDISPRPPRPYKWLWLRLPVWWSANEEDVVYEFHIPANSIQTSYSLDPS